MFRYIVRRILLAIPTLLVISLAIFGLSKCAPRDPALELGEGSFGDYKQQEYAVRLRAKKLGLDKPAFYFTLTTAAFPDTMYRILPPDRRKRLAKLCAQTGNWPAVSRYEMASLALWDFANALPDTLSRAGDFRVASADMVQCEHADALVEMMVKTRQSSAFFSQPQLQVLLDTLQNCVGVLQTQMRPGRMNIPAFYWHGLDNQYHRWLIGLVTGDLGLSRLSQKPVGESLQFSLFSTLIINGFAILLAYLVAVPLGVAMARRQGKATDQIAQWVLLLLYSMPVFWLGSLLILFFATPGFGWNIIDGIDLEPWQASGKTFWNWCWSNFDKFILPILTLSLHALAILALQMRGGVLENMGQDFVRTARAKGVDENTVYWHHVFRNALFPIITVFASVFPAIFAGSLAVEFLFQFPGLGLKTHEAFLGGDYPVLFAILMLAAALTVAGNLVADMLYAWADPRVRFA